MFLEAGMSKTKTCGKGLLPGLPKDAFSLHPHRRMRSTLEPLPLLSRALILPQGPLSTTSSGPKHLQKAPPPNAVALTIRIVTCKSGVRRWGRARLLHN